MKRMGLEALYRRPNTSKPAPGHKIYPYASVPEARAGIGRYIAFYNAVRPHSALGGRTPDQIYFGQPLLAAA